MYLGLTSEDGNPHLGRLDFLDNQVNPQTGTIRGRAVFDNAKGQFTPGLYARLKLVGSGTYAAALIKDEAVGTDLGKKFVLVLDRDNKTVYRTVELGPKLEGLRIVRSGLGKGERIVVNGLQRVRPGMPRWTPRGSRWPAPTPSPPSKISAVRWRASRRRRWPKSPSNRARLAADPTRTSSARILPSAGQARRKAVRKRSSL